MNRALRIAVRSLIILLIAFGTAALLLSAAVMTPPVQRGIKAAIEGFASQRLGNQVTIGAIHLNWIERFDFHDVAVVDHEFGDSLAIRSLRIRFALLPLLKKKLELKRITIRGATVTGVRTKAGVHFPFIPKHPPKVKIWTVTLGTAVVSGLSARYDDSVKGMSYSLSGIRSRLVFKHLDSFFGTLGADTGEAMTPWYSGRVRSVDIRADFSRKKLVVLRGVIKGDSTTLTCQGTIPFSSNTPWNAHADVSTSLSPLL
jgi:autotransporter translocation and assembly factor TamB